MPPALFKPMAMVRFGSGILPLENGLSDLDSSDDACFTALINELDAQAKCAGCFALSGASSVPAISASVVRGAVGRLRDHSRDRNRHYAWQPSATRPIRLDRTLPGDVFGEFSLLTGKRRSAFVTTATDAIVYEIAKEHLKSILRQRPKLAGNLAEVMERHQSQNEERWRALSASDGAAAPTDAAPNLMRRICSFFGLPV